MLAATTGFMELTSGLCRSVVIDTRKGDPLFTAKQCNACATVSTTSSFAHVSTACQSDCPHMQLHKNTHSNALSMQTPQGHYSL